MSKHTPGPWHVGYDTIFGIWNLQSIGDEKCLLLQDAGYSCHINLKIGDYYLIAAAPDMLEALEALLPLAEDFYYDVNHGDEYVEQFVKARAAIAKAKGEQP